MNDCGSYRGRFAPSPTGPLHAGSLAAALASWLDARVHGGAWLIRIEDVDSSRCKPEWAQAQLQQLAAHGLVSDELVLWQSTRSAAYAAALVQPQAQGLVYACHCSRKKISDYWLAQGVDKARHGDLLYPGFCRDAALPAGDGIALRLDVGQALSWHEGEKARHSRESGNPPAENPETPGQSPNISEVDASLRLSRGQALHWHEGDMDSRFHGNDEFPKAMSSLHPYSRENLMSRHSRESGNLGIGAFAAADSQPSPLPLSLGERGNPWIPAGAGMVLPHPLPHWGRARVGADGTNAPELPWADRHLGAQSQNIAAEVGDFVLRRADGCYSYQLAVVVDDAAQGINHVVRGQDLLDNTPRQILLQKVLGLPTPQYLHTPLVLAADGQKLSKQNGAAALGSSKPAQCLANLQAAALALGLPAPSLNPHTQLADYLRSLLPLWTQSDIFRVF